MPTIRLKTEIHAPIERVFDLTRSIDVHTVSTSRTREQAIAGVTRGLIGLDEEVTFTAVHFWQKRTLTSRVTEYARPDHFRDSQVEGPFRSFDHDHSFTAQDEVTVMQDAFTYTLPYGLLGQIFNFIFFQGYLSRFLKRRHRVIKEIAEGRNWKLYLPQE